MSHIRNRMDSFLALPQTCPSERSLCNLLKSFLSVHSIVPKTYDSSEDEKLVRRRDGSLDIRVTFSVRNGAEYWWPNYTINQNLFKREYCEFLHRTNFLFARLDELRRFKDVVVKSQKGKNIDSNVLELLWGLHEENPFSESFSNLLDTLWYGQSDKYDDAYNEDYHVSGTRESDDNDDQYYPTEIEFGDYDHYAMYPGSYSEEKNSKKKQKKGTRVDIYKQCLNDIKEEQKKLQIAYSVQQEGYDYCMYAVCMHINLKTTNNWHILSLILDYL